MNFGPAKPGVVVFDYPAWIVAYPEFGGVQMGQAQELFNRATRLCDNTPSSPITNLFTRTLLLNAATAHFASLFTPGADGTIRPPGRISSASEGSVSLSLDSIAAATDTQAFWNQTQYGAFFWAASLPYRSFKYIHGIQPALGPGGYFTGRRRGFF